MIRAIFNSDEAWKPASGALFSSRQWSTISFDCGLSLGYKLLPEIATRQSALSCLWIWGHLFDDSSSWDWHLHPW